MRGPIERLNSRLFNDGSISESINSEQDSAELRAVEYVGYLGAATSTAISVISASALSSPMFIMEGDIHSKSLMSQATETGLNVITRAPALGLLLLGGVGVVESLGFASQARSRRKELEQDQATE